MYNPFSFFLQTIARTKLTVRKKKYTSLDVSIPVFNSPKLFKVKTKLGQLFIFIMVI